MADGSMGGVSVSFLNTEAEVQVLRSDYGGQSPRNSPFIPMSQPPGSSPPPSRFPRWYLTGTS